MEEEFWGMISGKEKEIYFDGANQRLLNTEELKRGHRTSTRRGALTAIRRAKSNHSKSTHLILSSTTSLPSDNTIIRDSALCKVVLQTSEFQEDSPPYSPKTYVSLFIFLRKPSLRHRHAQNPRMPCGPWGDCPF